MAKIRKLLYQNGQNSSTNKRNNGDSQRYSQGRLPLTAMPHHQLNQSNQRREATNNTQVNGENARHTNLCTDNPSIDVNKCENCSENRHKPQNAILYALLSCLKLFAI